MAAFTVWKFDDPDGADQAAVVQIGRIGDRDREDGGRERRQELLRRRNR